MNNLSEMQTSISYLKNEVEGLKKKKSIEDIILKSTFKVLAFYGTAAGSANLSKSFDDSIFSNKSILIKSLKIVPYMSADTVDITMTDGVTTSNETVVAGLRINRIFDSYTGAVASYLRLLINGKNEIFTVDNNGTPDLLPSDYEFDNVYAFYENMRSIDVLCYFENSDPGGTATNPNVKVYLECYIF